MRHYLRALQLGGFAGLVYAVRLRLNMALQCRQERLMAFEDRTHELRLAGLREELCGHLDTLQVQYDQLFQAYTQARNQEVSAHLQMRGELRGELNELIGQHQELSIAAASLQSARAQGQVGA